MSRVLIDAVIDRGKDRKCGDDLTTLARGIRNFFSTRNVNSVGVIPSIFRVSPDRIGNANSIIVLIV